MSMGSRASASGSSQTPTSVGLEILYLKNNILALERKIEELENKYNTLACVDHD